MLRLYYPCRLALRNWIFWAFSVSLRQDTTLVGWSGPEVSRLLFNAKAVLRSLKSEFSTVPPLTSTYCVLLSFESLVGNTLSVHLLFSSIPFVSGPVLSFNLDISRFLEQKYPFDMKFFVLVCTPHLVTCIHWFGSRKMPLACSLLWSFFETLGSVHVT